MTFYLIFALRSISAQSRSAQKYRYRIILTGSKVSVSLCAVYVTIFFSFLIEAHKEYFSLMTGGNSLDEEYRAGISCVVSDNGFETATGRHA